MIDHALALAARGFAVFPCHRMTEAGCSCARAACDSPGKHPVPRDGFKSATRDPDAIKQMWGSEPWNIGIATGAVSGILVIDIDSTDAAVIAAARAAFPASLTARTGSGGLHIYLSHPGGARIGNTAKRLGPAIDSRGDGGYVVAPPSNHASGGVYAWEDAAVPIAPCPPEVVEAMRRRGPRAGAVAAVKPASPPLEQAASKQPVNESGRAEKPAQTRSSTPASNDPTRERDRERRYALAALEGAARDLAAVPDGGGRNQAAYDKAHKVGGYIPRHLSEAEAEAHLLHATRAGGWERADERKTIDTIRRGLRDGASRPLAVPEAPPAPVRSPSATSHAVAPTEADERAAIEGEEPTMPTATTTPATAAPDETIDPARALLAQAAAIVAPTLLLKRDKKTGEVKATYANTVATVRHIYGGGPTNQKRRLAFNEMTLTPVVDGKPQREGHDLSALRERIELDHGFAPSAENVKAAVLHVAHEQSFHPVRAFLDSRPTWDGTPRAEHIVRFVFKLDPASQPLAAVFIEKWLISAVARAYEPGCQVDTALVLFGHQGLRKSSCYRVLGGPWFRDTKMDITNKDAYLQLHSAWITEWGEIDAITSQRHAGEVKGFITSPEDTFRAPYAAAVSSHPRSGVIVGSTNKEKFLADPTGSRRFWIIDLDHLDPMRGDRLDLQSLALMRDQIWAEAIHRFRAFQAARAAGVDPDANPHKWWLTPEEDAAREHAAERHAIEDHPWREFVERWLAKKEAKGALRPLDYPQDQIHISDIFDAMKLEPAHRKHSDAITMGSVLRSLGFERRKMRTHYGDKPTVWMWLRERGGPPDPRPDHLAPVIPIR